MRECFTAMLITPETFHLKNEFLVLVETAGYHSVHHVEQKTSARARFFFGEGKIEEIGSFISDWCEQNGSAEKLIFGNNLTPTQLLNVENKINSQDLLKQGFEIEVMDKFQLILEIFEQHATTEESRIQTELAAKRYMLPFQKERLKAKLGTARKGKDVTGTSAGTGVSPISILETDFKRSRTTSQKKLDALTKKRSDRRKKYRKQPSILTISLLGYTAAGKSSLLNAIVGPDTAKVAPTLFTTLTTKTKGVKLDDLTVLISDTVGFIEDLPPFLFDAFKSTLEEATDTEMVFCIVDASEDQETILRKLGVTFEVLEELGPRENVGILLTKRDLLKNPEDLQVKLDTVAETFPGFSLKAISSIEDKSGIMGLWELVSTFYPREEFTVKVPLELELVKYQFYKKNLVSSESYDQEHDMITLLIATRRPEWFRNWIRSVENKAEAKLLVL